MCEVTEESTYAPHHKKKIAFILSAMRHFAEELRAAGWEVDYVRLDDPGNTGTLTGELDRAAARWSPREIVMTEPGEWRLRTAFENWRPPDRRFFEIREDDRFLCSHSAFRDWRQGRRSLRMEHFYRMMRRHTGLLMEDGKPSGGRWNFDAQNRKPARPELSFPKRQVFAPDAITSDVLELVADRFPDAFGRLEPFGFAVTRADAGYALDEFIRDALPYFGDYQDAMVAGEPCLYHSVLSGYINIGLLDPLEVCRSAEAAYRNGSAPINAVEGFIRQILGWREFVRGIYWSEMPGYALMNHFAANRPLPNFYWTGETDIACLSAAIGQTRDEAYAHHIQRLMVTGTFAMLAGVDPRQIHDWYLGVYIDAFEWVELPNVIGMSQFADGGLLASKPYAASGAYIDRMSDYCSGCRYNVREKSTADACPFNALYWHFLDRNTDALAGNPRLGPVYRTWEKMSSDRRKALIDHGEWLLSRINSL
jgi:deoxyribodipyrimidine photolyase-related protein